MNYNYDDVQRNDKVCLYLIPEVERKGECEECMGGFNNILFFKPGVVLLTSVYVLYSIHLFTPQRYMDHLLCGRFKANNWYITEKTDEKSVPLWSLNVLEEEYKNKFKILLVYVKNKFMYLVPQEERCSNLRRVGSTGYRRNIHSD